MRLALLLALLPACGLAGGTSAFVLDDLPAARAGAPAPRVGWVDRDPAGAKLVAIGAYAWGKYSDADLDVLTRSLAGSLGRLAPPGAAGALDVYVVVRTFLIASSNSGGGILACIAWAATDPSGQLVYHEQFYASDSAHLNTTLGWLKDRVHKAIVRRIALTARAVAEGAGPVKPAAVERTFDAFEAASADLPTELTSTFITMFNFGVPYAFSIHSVSGNVSWDFAAKPELVNWPAVLAARKRAPPP